MKPTLLYISMLGDHVVSKTVSRPAICAFPRWLPLRSEDETLTQEEAYRPS